LITLSNSRYYRKQELWSLFLMCAFPLYFWTLLLAFRDVSWLTERTNAWDAVGVVSYGMVFASVESVIVFIIAVLLGFLVSRSWSGERRGALLGVLALIASLWATADQLYFLWGTPLPAWIFQILVKSAHPVRIIYGVLLALVAPTVILPAYFILQTDKGLQAAQNFIERITLLSMLYLFSAFAGLVVVIIRNI